MITLSMLRAPTVALVMLLAGSGNHANVANDRVPSGPANATIDLDTKDGLQLVNGEWRYSDARIVEADFRSPGPDRKPTGAPNRTYDVEPHAGPADYDDSNWKVLPAGSLAERRASGKLSFNWYRLKITVPSRIGSFDPTGSTAVFDIVVDDYAEVWVDGALPRDLGARNEQLVQGWNAANRLVIARNVRPGQQIQLAVFGINGPLSDPPPNYIWIRSARLEFYREPRAITPKSVKLAVTRLDPALDRILPTEATLEQLAEGFLFTEGPVWTPDGALLFSDPNANRIYRWTPAGQLSIYRERSGYEGDDVARYRQPGSNGLAFDRAGRLTINEHGNRRITRLERDGRLTVLADRYDGKRLNSPNDLVYKSDGSLYFTDPNFGLPGLENDPGKELPYAAVFRLLNGQLQPLFTGLNGPNGIAFSPDERFLYVGDWDPAHKVVVRYPVKADGTLGRGETFLDLGDVPGEEAIDGVKVDREGNVYVSGPGGLWVVSPQGKRLGVLRGPELAANFAWGDADARTLYLTARTGLYRIRLNIPGVR